MDNTVLSQEVPGGDPTQNVSTSTLISETVDKLELGSADFLGESDADVVGWWQDLVAVHLLVGFGALAAEQLEVEAVYKVDDEELDL